MADFSGPVLSHASDPRLMGKGNKVAYEFDGNGLIGFLHSERSGVTNEEIAHTDSDGVHTPKAVYPGGRVVNYDWDEGRTGMALT